VQAFPGIYGKLSNPEPKERLFSWLLLLFSSSDRAIGDALLPRRDSSAVPAALPGAEIVASDCVGDHNLQRLSEGVDQAVLDAVVADRRVAR
jgi:hypothetical protein